ncbi:hypothetical protein SAMN05421774_1161 [Gemmobacter megaterium]|uniref:Uncharacterized protein n=1 Tax=Gemmobacter megaterium TaxID=1086013 RepID=A0A1N7QMM3_9RHOB|nr:hypothetical protein [Gemmobacter megaterium]SIT24044.1 hypothetical protein SAMN05421774_1161 [Gemmobacter megaterium]
MIGLVEVWEKTLRDWDAACEGSGGPRLEQAHYAASDAIEACEITSAGEAAALLRVMWKEGLADQDEFPFVRRRMLAMLKSWVERQAAVEALGA